MSLEIKMPALSPTMTEGKLSKWLVKEGDKVISGDVIAEIETDKATMEVETIDDGIISKIFVSENTEGVEVGKIIALLSKEGENLDIEKVDKEEEKLIDNFTQKVEKKPEILSVDTSNKDINTKIIKEKRIFASPLAKNLANSHNINLDKIIGTGPKNRIIRKDIEYYLKNNINQNKNYNLIPHSPMRRIIAQRLSNSKNTAPHFYLTMECNIDNLLEMRRRLNTNNDSNNISLNDMIIKAAACALEFVPEVNGTYEEDGCKYYDDVNICVAVAIKDGLVTPVIRNVNNISLKEISILSKNLISNARKKSLKTKDFEGGTFTISNLGMYDINNFTAIINPPQSAILAIGKGIKKPIVFQEKIIISTLMNVTLSCDHRIIDGAIGALWLKTFKEIIENPLTLITKYINRT